MRTLAISPPQLFGAMMQLFSLKSLVLCALITPAISHANLIINGSFEANTLPKNSWTTLSNGKVSGWQGSNIELWHQLYNLQSAAGQQHAELNAHGQFDGQWSIFQPFSTVAGNRYDLSFAYRARANDKEAFRFTVADLNQVIDDHTTKSWSYFKTTFVATSNTTTLRFTSLNTGTVGNFLDDIQVFASPVTKAVPESPTLPLLLVAAVGLWWRRRLKLRG